MCTHKHITKLSSFSCEQNGMGLSAREEKWEEEGGGDRGGKPTKKTRC